jgi:hypothetical protein
MLKKYKCHKEVHAEPMTLGEFKVHSSKVDLIGNPDTEGYLVVYNQGTEAEYHSWSPKDIFDAGYSVVTE